MKQDLKALAKAYKADDWATHIAVFDITDKESGAHMLALRDCVYILDGDMYLDSPDGGEDCSVFEVIGYDSIIEIER